MSKLATPHVAAGVAAGALACGALASCAAIWDIEDPLPLTDAGGTDAPVMDSAVPVEEETSADAGPADTVVVVDADGATSDVPDVPDAPPPFYPDAGYTMTEPASPIFVDACSVSGSVTVLASHTDSDTGKLPLPFAFDFYGVPQAEYWANTKGVVGFDGVATHIGSFTCPLPNTFVDPYPAVYAFADDLETRTTGMCLAVAGTKPNRRLVITWENAALVSDTASHLTFSVVLTETTHTIDLLYETMTGPTEAQGTLAVIGLEDQSGTLYTQFTCQSMKPVITSTPFAIRFTPN
jgi:hypothetical protein